MAENEYILEVKNLCQHFSSGHGKNKMVVKAVDDVSFALRKNHNGPHHNPSV